MLDIQDLIYWSCVGLSTCEYFMLIKKKHTTVNHKTTASSMFVLVPQFISHCCKAAIYWWEWLTASLFPLEQGGTLGVGGHLQSQLLLIVLDVCPSVWHKTSSWWETGSYQNVQHSVACSISQTRTYAKNNADIKILHANTHMSRDCLVIRAPASGATSVTRLD